MTFEILNATGTIIDTCEHQDLETAELYASCCFPDAATIRPVTKLNENPTPATETQDETNTTKGETEMTTTTTNATPVNENTTPATGTQNETNTKGETQMTTTTPATPAAPKAKKTKPLVACWCGCGGTTKSRFVPGHDARFHGLAKKVARGEADEAASLAALPHDDARTEFLRHVAAERPKAEAKALADAAAKAAKEQAKAAKEATQPAPVNETPPPATTPLADAA